MTRRIHLTSAATDQAEHTVKGGPEATNKLGQVNANGGNQGGTKQDSDAKVTESDTHIDKSKTARFNFGQIGSDLPTYLFDWKQRIFGTDDKFKTDWPSTNLEAYIRLNPSFAKPTKVPFGHKRLHYGLNKVIKDQQKGSSTWNRYVELGEVARLVIDDVVEEANRNQSRERVCVAFEEYKKESLEPFTLVFLSVRKEPQPISFKDAVGRNYTLPFEACRKWEVSIPFARGKNLMDFAILSIMILIIVQAMKGTIIEAFNHVQVIGPHVIEGHFDLGKWIQVLPTRPLHGCEAQQSLDTPAAAKPCRARNTRTRTSLTLSK